MEEKDEIADAIESVATWIKYLGTGNAATQMGAVEFLAKETKDGLNMVADAIFELASVLDREKNG